MTFFTCIFTTTYLYWSVDNECHRKNLYDHQNWEFRVPWNGLKCKIDIFFGLLESWLPAYCLSRLVISPIQANRLATPEAIPSSCLKYQKKKSEWVCWIFRRFQQFSVIWHSTQGHYPDLNRPVLALLLNLNAYRRAASTICKVFGMTRPGIKPWSPHMWSKHSTTRPPQW